MLTTIGLKYFPDQGPVHTRPHQILLQRTGLQNVILRTGLSLSPLDNFFGDVLSRASWVTESCCARHQSLSAWPTWQLFQTFSLASSSTNLCRFYCIPSKQTSNKVSKRNAKGARQGAGWGVQLFKSSALLSAAFRVGFFSNGMYRIKHNGSGS